MSARPLPPLDTLPLIREVDAALVELLRALTPEQWLLPAVKSWRVRDVAAHLLDTNLRRLSLDRDRWRPSGSPEGDDYRALVEFLDRLNAEWVQAAERLSPEVLTEWLETTNRQVFAYFDSLDPEAPAAFPVAWAGDDHSPVWMDVARELTEKWHHQQQIRRAVDRPGLLEPRYVEAVLNTFARALPRAYGGVEAPAQTSVLIEISDLLGCRWRLVSAEQGWDLFDAAGDADETTDQAQISLPGDTAWRLWTKGLSPDEAEAQATTAGPPEFVRPFFHTLAIMG